MESPLPAPFLARMEELLGEEYPDFLQSYEKPKGTGLRVNPLKVTPEEFAARSPFPLQPVPWCREGFFVEGEERPGKHPLHHAGVYYLQEPSAMGVVQLLDPRPGERVLDLCAAPGGKSTHIAGRLMGQGLLVSNEIHPARVKALGENLERFGTTNAVITNEAPDRLAQTLAGYFDAVVVDAPCSGEGMFRKDPDACAHWSPEGTLGCAKRQMDILHAGAAMVRLGGRLVYSTCTFNPEENEGVLAEFLATCPDFALVEVPAPVGWSPGRPQWVEGPPELARAFRLWPHRLRGEGHFLALLQRQGNPLPPPPPAHAGKPLRPPAEFTAFLAETLDAGLDEALGCQEAGLLHRQGDLLFRLPPRLPDFGRLKVLRRGLLLGELKKGRFEPAHHLAMALLPQHVRRKADLALAETEAYLRGETIPREGPKGWTLVAYGGFPLGWAKQADGQLKNHYPKGLRR